MEFFGECSSAGKLHANNVIIVTESVGFRAWRQRINCLAASEVTQRT